MATTSFTVSTPMWVVPTTTGLVETAYRPITLGDDITFYETNRLATYSYDSPYWYW
ncbi:MAG: hypothetical protein LUD38_07545 [Parabacteroides sp.]|nr:hypothetical protein [Parabacteroides sp.]